MELVQIKLVIYLDPLPISDPSARRRALIRLL